MKLQNQDVESSLSGISKSQVFIIIVSFIYWVLSIQAHLFKLFSCPGFIS